jgi:Autotransporter beta-domain
LRLAGTALAALLLAPLPGAAAELCPPASSVRLALCESLIDPTSDRLQARIDSRLNVTAPTEDSASPVWLDTRQVTSQPASLDAPAPTTVYFGADYRLGSDVLIGAMVQRDNRSANPLIDSDGIAPDVYLAGPYAAYRLSPNLVFGARAAWGESSDGTTSDSDQESLTRSRLLTEARLSGNWAVGNWQLMPAASITYVDDAAVASISGLSDITVQTTRLTAGPQIRRQFDAGDIGSLEPFAFFRTSLDLDSIEVVPDAARHTIGGGVALNQPDGYSIQAIANFSETIGAELPDPALTGKVSVSMPLQ